MIHYKVVILSQAMLLFRKGESVTATEKYTILLQYFIDRKGAKIDSYDKELQSKLEIGQRQLARELQTLAQHHNEIIACKEGRKKCYMLVDKPAILKEAFANDMKLGMLFQMAQEGMPEILEEWQELAKGLDKPYLFYNMPYEEIDLFEQNPNFISLKNAIVRREYRTITLKGDNPKCFKDIKPIRLLFSEGNWYVAYVDGETLRISRIQFIKEVSYSRKVENYQPITVAPHIEWLEKQFQNSFSRYKKPAKEAILLAKPHIAHYFQKGMKRFFRSQRFIERLDDGSVRFGVSYTQPMEILPFVQCWMPDLVIELPEELRKKYQKKLQVVISDYQGLG